MLKHINQISEQAFLLDFGSKIDIQTNNFVISFANHILSNVKLINILGIKNCVPSYNKILIQFTPGSQKKRKIFDFLYSIDLNEIISKKTTESHEIIEIPICYEEKYSLDLKENSAMVTFMAIRNDYSSFTGDVNEILQATISHEFFHAIQYGYDGWEAGWLLESTAVWMEELHYDHINDCYQFLEYNMEYPEEGLFKDTQRGYGSYIFFSYIEENYLDSRYVKNIFEKSIDYYSYDFDNSLSPVIDILTSNSLEITSVIKDLAISNVLLDGNAQPEIYQFEEADEYNGFGMYISNSITTIEDSVLTFDNESIWSTGSRFYKFINLDSTLESITVLLSDQDFNNEYYYLQTITKLENGSYNILDGLPQTVLSSYSDTLLFSLTYYNGYTL